MVSDLVLAGELPTAIRNSIDAYVGYLAGAVLKNEYLRVIQAAGFENVEIVSQTNYPLKAMANDATAQAIKKDPDMKGADLKSIEATVLSIKVSAVKPSLHRKERTVKIEIFGTGCPKCKQLTANTEAAVKELNIAAEISKVTDIDKIIGSGVVITPALAVDGTVVSAGKLLNKDEIKKILTK